MNRAAPFVLALALSALLPACFSDTRPVGDAGPIRIRVDAAASDAGPRRDGTVTTDAGGSSSACNADMSAASSTVGCNGGVYGPTQRPNEIDGPCTPDGSDGPGTCFTPAGGATPVCYDDGSGGVCVYPCPFVSSYVSQGGCPTGSRCFQVDTDISACFRDCAGASDCFGGESCDAEGSCAP